MLSKDQIIGRILQMNPSANAAWLEEFDHCALHRYHDHLEQTLEPRGAQSVWRRDGETPAVVTRKPAA